MGEPHVISALSNKRAELAGIVSQLERQLGQQQANLAHLDATMRLFDPDIRPNKIRPRHQRARSVWFRPGECLRLIYDELRDAVQPMTTRELPSGSCASRPCRWLMTANGSWFRKRSSVRSTGPRRRSRASRPRGSSVGGWPKRHARVASSRRNRPTACTASPARRRYTPARRC